VHWVRRSLGVPLLLQKLLVSFVAKANTAVVVVLQKLLVSFFAKANTAVVVVLGTHNLQAFIIHVA
jgi:hypothetical protein